MKPHPYNDAGAVLSAVFGELTPAQRGRLLATLAKTDDAVCGLVDRMKILTSSPWSTGGLTVEHYPGPPPKACLSAYIEDGETLTFAVELVRGDFFADLDRDASRWYVDAEVTVLSAGVDQPQVALAMETIECSTVDNAAIGLTLASGWLQSVIMSRPPTADDWLADAGD